VHDNFIRSGGSRLPDSAAMKISLNGETVDAREAKTIADLIERYELPPQSILVEHNGLAVHRHEWSERQLAEGDRIEFIRVVAGG
jgi:thiamine biosynthesis protein ThiS